MHIEAFVVRMKNEGWELLEPVDTSRGMVLRSEPQVEYKKFDYSFQRGCFIVNVYDRDVVPLADDDFDAYLKRITTGFHFFDDWKKAFVGSEFLIPVVEEELNQRLIMNLHSFSTKLFSVAQGLCTLEDVKKDIDTRLEALNINRQKK